MGKQEENHVLSHWVCWLISPSIPLRVLTCGRKLLGLWPATQESPSARWSAPNFHQPDSVILQVRAQPAHPPQGPPGGGAKAPWRSGLGLRRACGAGVWGGVTAAARCVRLQQSGRAVSVESWRSPDLKEPEAGFEALAKRGSAPQSPL